MTTILNLPGLNVLRVEDAEHDYHVYAETPGNAAACPHCQSDAVVGFGRHERLIRDLPSHGKRVGIYLNSRRYRCRGCAKTFFERLPVVDDSRDMTRRLVEWIGKQSVKRHIHPRKLRKPARRLHADSRPCKNEYPRRRIS